MEHKLRKGDVILIGCILLLAVFLLGARWFNNNAVANTGEDYYATIKVDNKLFQTVKLTDEPQIIEVRTNRGYDILKVHNKGIEVVESDCPQKICFSYGLISRPNQSIICLPMRMVIEINGAGNNIVDDEIDAFVS